MTEIRYALYMRYTRFVVPPLLTLVAALLLWTGAAHAGSEYEQTCRFFSNAAFQDRHRIGQSTFRMQLAQDCVDAQLYRWSADPEVRERAGAYLAQLEAFRGLMVDMLVARARERTTLTQDHRGDQRWGPPVHPISRAGAYLIAREMGLVETHRDWTTWRRSAALPLLRLDAARAN